MKRKCIALLLTLCLLVGILPAGVLAAGNQVTVDGFTFSFVADTAVLKSCEIQDTDTITVPGEVDGKPVETIDMYALSGARNVNKIVIPEGVKTVNVAAFSGSDVREVLLPDTLETIGASAFENCVNLESVCLPDSVTNVSFLLFHGCTSLREVQLPAAMTELPQSIFSGCTALEEYAIPEGITAVGFRAFENCTGLKKVTIPESLVSISKDAFENCTALAEISGSASGTGIIVVSNMLVDAAGGTLIFYPAKNPARSVEIPDCVRKIGNDAFAACSNLEQVTIPGNVSDIGIDAFRDCTKLRTVRMSEGVKSVGSSAFSGCTALQNVTLPESLEEISAYAFADCTSLKRIEIPVNLGILGYGCFSGDDVVIAGYEGSAAEEFAKTYGYRFESLGQAPDRTDVLPVERLRYEIVDGHAVITGSEFRKDYYAKGIVIPEEIDGYPVTEIRSRAFQNTDGLEYVEIPDTVTKMGDTVFYNCRDLQWVTLPAGLTEIPMYTFWQCGSLELVNIPEQVTSIGHSAFLGCKKLAVFVLPETVTEIGQCAFESCTALEDIYLPEGLKTIGGRAFYQCTALKELYVPSTVTSMGAESYVGTDCTLYAYAGSDAVRYGRRNEVELVLMAFDDDNEAGTWTWASDSIYNCVAVGLINGYPGNLFLPDKNLSRIELVAILYRLYQELDLGYQGGWVSHPFTDAKDAWYQNALDWAYYNGIVNGKTTTTFAPGDPVKRQEMAAILYRFLTTYFEMDPVTSNNLDQYRDAGQVDAYARTAMEFCISEGIISGVGGGLLAPKNSTTRAQIACVMDRAFIR